MKTVVNTIKDRLRVDTMLSGLDALDRMILLVKMASEMDIDLTHSNLVDMAELHMMKELISLGFADETKDKIKENGYTAHVYPIDGVIIFSTEKSSKYTYDILLDDIVINGHTTIYDDDNIYEFLSLISDEIDGLRSAIMDARDVLMRTISEEED